MSWRVLNISLTTLLVVVLIFLVLINVRPRNGEAVPKPQSVAPSNITTTTDTKITTANGVSSTTDHVNTAQTISITTPVRMFEYIKVTDSCGPYFGGTCLNLRSGAGINFPSVGLLRNGIVLKTVGTTTDGEGRVWYKIIFDEWLRYPERAEGDHFLSADYVTPFFDQGVQNTKNGDPVSGTKTIIIDRSEQTLTAFDGEDLFMKEKISTGVELSPTPDGTFFIFKKTPTRYMQGPLPNIEKVFDLPGVPWVLYFSVAGDAIHGAYWHNEFGVQKSSGCVNVNPEKAEILYKWAELGTTVIVQE